MKLKRLYHTIRFALALGSYRRAQYLRNHHIFGLIGYHSTVMARTIPLYPELIKLHDRVHIASGVRLITHDISHVVVNCAYRTNLHEQVGCIEIMDNVYVGADAIIMPNVRIGPNVIIGAGSIVTKDVPSNVVVAGVPAKAICSLDEYRDKRLNAEAIPEDLLPRNQKCSPELADWMWNRFEAKRAKQ